MGELGPITILALDVLAFALLVAALLGPLLWKTRQRLRLRVVDEAGRPRVSLPIYGEYNVTVAARHATGEGAIPGRQLDGARKLLGVTDDEGRFARTYLLRKFYGILVGNRTVYLNEGDTSGAKELEIVVTRVDGPLGEDWEARFRGES